MPIHKSEIIPQLLKECPEVQKDWDKYLSWMESGKKKRNCNLDASAVVLFVIIPSYRSGRLHFWPRFFSLLERLLTDGHTETRSITVETILKGLQRASVTRIDGPDLFGNWMGPETKRHWQAILAEVAQSHGHGAPARRKRREYLREYRVDLTKCKPEEKAVPTNYPETLGLGKATKLGGDPDWLQTDERPNCPCCKQLMTFVGQIDSIEHIRVDPKAKLDFGAIGGLRRDQQWMFGDVGMIYVFFCFDCLETRSVFQCH